MSWRMWAHGTDVSGIEGDPLPGTVDDPVQIEVFLVEEPATYFLYECTECGERTFLGPEGGRLNPCLCGTTADAVITPLYAGGRLLGKRLSELAS